MYDFTSFPDRRKTESVKWGIYPEDVLPMWVADMDFVSPPEVIEALQQRVAHGVFGYPLVVKELKEVVVRRMFERYHWQIQEEDLIFVPGVVSGFNLVCQAFTGAGESIIMNSPVYPPFREAPQHAGARKIEVNFVQDSKGNYIVDEDVFEAAIQANTRVFMLCNPHNPLGKVFSKNELETLAAICLRHHVLICSDEIHSDLIFSGHQHTPIAAINEEISRQTVTLIAPSKTFNIAGLECSVIICQNPEYRQKIQEARRGLLGGVNVLGLSAGLSAYRDGQAWLDELLVVLEHNRDLLCDYIQKEIPNIKIHKPEATYLAWLDCRNLDLAEDPYHFFLKQAKVAMNEGSEFGQAGEGFLRLNFGCPSKMLQDALQRMKNSLSK